MKDVIEKGDVLTIITLKGFRYKGPFIEEDENFYTIFDFVSQQRISLNKKTIASVQGVPEGGE